MKSWQNLKVKLSKRIISTGLRRRSWVSLKRQVKKLTITQGIILVKLIDRETGHTSYEVIKDLKGGFTAFFWQGIARIFGNNLKAEYNPDGEDAKIEDIVRGIESGFL